MSHNKDLDITLLSLLNETEKLPNLLENTSKSLDILHDLFSFAVKTTDRRFGSIVELIVHKVDNETIWEELQCRNRPHNKYVKKLLGRLHARVRQSEATSHTIAVAKKESSNLRKIDPIKEANKKGGAIIDVIQDEDDDDDIENHESDDKDGNDDSEEFEESSNIDIDENMEDFNGEDDYEEEDDEDDGGDDDEDEDEDDDEDADEADDEDAFPGMDDEPYDSQEEDETPLNKRQKRLQEQMSELEKEISGKKSWELLGEAKASDRPQNSLLSSYTDIERVSKPAPVITQEYTSSIEELIKKRISSEKFDNVTKLVALKNPPKDNNLLEGLSTEKSSIGLGDIYAKEFEKKALLVPDAKEDKKSELHIEVLRLYDQVSQELDGLTHFFYSPTPVLSDIALKSEAPISLEEFIPTAQASAVQPIPKKKIMATGNKRKFKKAS